MNAQKRFCLIVCSFSDVQKDGLACFLNGDPGIANVVTLLSKLEGDLACLPVVLSRERQELVHVVESWNPKSLD